VSSGVSQFRKNTPSTSWGELMERRHLDGSNVSRMLAFLSVYRKDTHVLTFLSKNDLRESDLVERISSRARKKRQGVSRPVSEIGEDLQFRRG